MAHSPYTNRAVSFVERNPGCCKYDLASYLRKNPRLNPSKLYRLVNTQIRLGYLVAIHRGNRYELFTAQQYRMITANERNMAS